MSYNPLYNISNLFNLPFGFNVVINDLACVTKEMKQFKFPKTKKVRIRNKWKKRNINFRLSDVHRAIKIGNQLHLSSFIFEKLKLNSK